MCNFSVNDLVVWAGDGHEYKVVEVFPGRPCSYNIERLSDQSLESKVPELDLVPA